MTSKNPVYDRIQAGGGFYDFIYKEECLAVTYYTSKIPPPTVTQKQILLKCTLYVQIFIFFLN